jgi:hypothetical protein
LLASPSPPRDIIAIGVDLVQKRESETLLAEVVELLSDVLFRPLPIPVFCFDLLSLRNYLFRQNPLAFAMRKVSQFKPNKPMNLDAARMPSACHV